MRANQSQAKVLALCGIVLLLDGFETQAIAFVAPSIAREWGVGSWELGLLFSATLLGAVAGSILFGILADRFGRRPLIIVATVIFGLSSAGCALSRELSDLLVWRLLGGIGMGGAIPNLNALSAEFAPRHLRATLVTLTLWGLPLGAVLGGFAAAPLIVEFGWRSVFWLGATAPLLVVVPLIIWLPEAPSFSRAGGTRDAGRLGHRGLLRLVLHPEALLLSMTTFLCLMLSYLLVNWTPTMLSQSGLPVWGAIFGTVAINLGGVVGSFFISRLVDSAHRPRLILAGACGCTIGALFAASLSLGQLWLVLPALFACGAFHIGAQISTASFATEVFPAAVRSTGLGAMHAIGKFGSLFGPMAGGAMLAEGFSVSQLLMLAAVPAALAGACLVWLHMLPARLRFPVVATADAAGELPCENLRAPHASFSLPRS